MELNAEMIKKALECCIGGIDCSECPYFDKDSCLRILNENALALIKSQEKRIKELTAENDVRKRCNIMLNNELRRIDNIKADTVRKMHSEINKTISALCKGDVSEIHRMIGQIAKEMLEGEK